MALLPKTQDPVVPSTAEVVVVGAGVVGAAIAFHLARRGVAKVVVCDKGNVAGQASGRSGALVRTHYTNIHEARIALAALPWFEEWTERVGGDCGFTPTGFLQMVAADDQETLHDNVRALQRIGVHTQLLRAEEIHQLQPHLRLRGDEHAAYEPRSGYADPVATTRGLATAAERLGARIYEGVTVTGISHGSQVREVQTTAGRIATPTVVLANGSWATNLIYPHGISVDLTPIRAQVALFRRPRQLPNGPNGHLTIIDRANGCYLRPQGEDLTLVGLSAFHRSVDDIDRYQQNVDQQFVDIALSKVTNRIPGFTRPRHVRGHSGPLDVTQDQRAILGATPGVEGLYLAIGMSGGGFKKAPAIGACLAELIIDGKATTAPIEPFRVSRFAENDSLTGAEYSLPSYDVQDGEDFVGRDLIH